MMWPRLSLVTEKPKRESSPNMYLNGTRHAARGTGGVGGGIG